MLLVFININKPNYIIDVNNKCPDVINRDELKYILDYRSKVKGICDVLTRDHMKVAFFGRFVII